MEASIDGHLEMTLSSLVATKQELNSTKDLQQKALEDNQKLTESVAGCHEQIQNLSSEVKTLKDAIVQQQEKQGDDMEKRISSVYQALKCEISQQQKQADDILNKKLNNIKSYIRERVRDRSFGQKKGYPLGQVEVVEEDYFWGGEEGLQLEDNHRSWGSDKDVSSNSEGEEDRLWGRCEDRTSGRLVERREISARAVRGVKVLKF